MMRRVSSIKVGDTLIRNNDGLEYVVKGIITDEGVEYYDFGGFIVSKAGLIKFFRNIKRDYHD